MISLRVGDCDVDIMPVVNGLISEAYRVRREFTDHECYGVALSIEGIQCLKNRRQIEDEFDVSSLDMVYVRHMERFGEVEIPSPAMYTFIDLVAEKGLNCIALDMNDSDFTDVYCKNVGALEFVTENNVAKKGMKRVLDGSTPEKVAIQWDEFVSTHIKSYGKINKIREEYIANEIRDVARYRKSLLAVIEVERADNVVKLLRQSDGM